GPGGPPLLLSLESVSPAGRGDRDGGPGARDGAAHRGRSAPPEEGQCDGGPWNDAADRHSPPPPVQLRAGFHCSVSRAPNAASSSSRASPVREERGITWSASTPSRSAIAGTSRFFSWRPSLSVLVSA